MARTPGTKARSTLGFLSAHRDESGGLAQELQLATPRLIQVSVEIQIGWIAFQRSLGLRNGAINGSQVLLDDPDSRAIELSSTGREYTFEIGNGGRVARVRAASPAGRGVDRRRISAGFRRHHRSDTLLSWGP